MWDGLQAPIDTWWASDGQSRYNGREKKWESTLGLYTEQLLSVMGYESTIFQLPVAFWKGEKVIQKVRL